MALTSELSIRYLRPAGLSDAALRAAARRVRIPISAEVDSINVGHAAAIAFAMATCSWNSSLDMRQG